MMTTTMHDVLIAAEQVTKTFPLLEGRGVFTVLQGVWLMVQLGRWWRSWGGAVAARAL